MPEGITPESPSRPVQIAPVAGVPAAEVVRASSTENQNTDFAAPATQEPVRLPLVTEAAAESPAVTVGKAVAHGEGGHTFIESTAELGVPSAETIKSAEVSNGQMLSDDLVSQLTTSTRSGVSVGPVSGVTPVAFSSTVGESRIELQSQSSAEVVSLA